MSRFRGWSAEACAAHFSWFECGVTLRYTNAPVNVDAGYGFSGSAVTARSWVFLSAVRASRRNVLISWSRSGNVQLAGNVERYFVILLVILPGGVRPVQTLGAAVE